MKADVIIQARTGSTRLHGKVLIEILGKPVLEYVIERVSKAKNVENVVIATSLKSEDQKIMRLAEKSGVKAFRGSEEDVLDRFYQAAKFFKMQHIVRVTADCPLMDAQVIDRVISQYFESGSDYCSNTLERSFPDGEDVEVFSFESLTCAWKEARLLSEREHVTPYITKNSDRFKLSNVKNEDDLSDKRWCLDREEDLEFIETVIESLYPGNRDFRMNDILAFLRSNPEVERINSNIKQNEGYRKSLEEDKALNMERMDG